MRRIFVSFKEKTLKRFSFTQKMLWFSFNVVYVSCAHHAVDLKKILSNWKFKFTSQLVWGKRSLKANVITIFSPHHQTSSSHHNTIVTMKSTLWCSILQLLLPPSIDTSLSSLPSQTYPPLLLALIAIPHQYQVDCCVNSVGEFIDL
jgi:hypothetical protein